MRTLAPFANPHSHTSKLNCFAAVQPTHNNTIRKVLRFSRVLEGTMEPSSAAPLAHAVDDTALVPDASSLEFEFADDEADMFDDLQVAPFRRAPPIVNMPRHGSGESVSLRYQVFDLHTHCFSHTRTHTLTHTHTHTHTHTRARARARTFAVSMIPVIHSSFLSTILLLTRYPPSPRVRHRVLLARGPRVAAVTRMQSLKGNGPKGVESHLLR
jgi:hypothetical protein